MLWFIIVIDSMILITFAAYIHEKRLRRQEQKNSQLLLRQLHTELAYLIRENHRLDMQRLETEMKQRTTQQGYIFDLPTHIPGSQCHYRN